MRRWACVNVCGNNGETWLTLGPDRTPYPLAKEGQYFTWDSQNNPRYLVAEVPNYPVTHIINREAMRAARKEIAPFVKYFNNMMKLTEWAPVETKTVYINGDAKAHAAMLSNDAEEWGRLLEWLVQNGTVSAYKHTQDPVTLSWTYGYKRYVSKSKIKDRLTTLLLRVHRSKLLTKRTHTTGGWVKDAYKDYADD